MRLILPRFRSRQFYIPYLSKMGAGTALKGFADSNCRLHHVLWIGRGRLPAGWRRKMFTKRCCEMETSVPPAG